MTCRVLHVVSIPPPFHPHLHLGAQRKQPRTAVYSAVRATAMAPTATTVDCPRAVGLDTPLQQFVCGGGTDRTRV